MSAATVRQRGEQAMPNDARMALRRFLRAEAKEEEARQAKEEAQAVLDAIHIATEARFGRQVPRDALLLDVLGQVEVEEGDVWRWRGWTNNHGTATFRTPDGRGERTVVRYLAISFGVIAEGTFGMLFPANGDRDDLNPWHRKLRESADPIQGNRFRFGASA